VGPLHGSITICFNNDMGLCGSGTKETPGEALERKQLEEKLREDHVDDVSVHKLLLLGPGESGKSTLFKQMITIYGHGFSEKDRKSYIPLIHRNLVACIDELAKQSVELPKQDDALENCKVVDSNAQKSLQFILGLKYEGMMSSEILKKCENTLGGSWIAKYLSKPVEISIE